MLNCFCFSLAESLPRIHQVLNFLQFSLRTSLQCLELTEGVFDVFVKSEYVPVSGLKAGQVTRCHVAQVLHRITCFDVVWEQPAQNSYTSDNFPIVSLTKIFLSFAEQIFAVLTFDDFNQLTLSGYSFIVDKEALI